MQTYKLATTANAIGSSPVQVIKSGKIVSVIWSATISGTTGQAMFAQLGVAAVDEWGTATAAPTSMSGIGAELITGRLSAEVNVQHQTDYPVSAGQNLVINNGNSTATCQIDCWVTIK